MPDPSALREIIERRAEEALPAETALRILVSGAGLVQQAIAKIEGGAEAAGVRDDLRDAARRLEAARSMLTGDGALSPATLRNFLATELAFAQALLAAVEQP